MSTATDPLHFISSFVDSFKPIYKNYWQSYWDVNTNSSTEALDKERIAKNGYIKFLADGTRFHEAKKFLDDPSLDNLTRRQIRMIYLKMGKNIQDVDSIDQMTRLESDIRKQYNNFRAQIDETSVTDNELDRILSTTTDSSTAEKAWLASKKIGAIVADTIRQIAKIRNRAAVAAGYRDHFQRTLLLQEIEEQSLLQLMTEIEEKTRPLFVRLKRHIDEQQASRFNIAIKNLCPWHYGDRFFQKAPPLETTNFNELFSHHDLVQLCQKSYASFGIDIKAIINRSDLYERSGKSQHAFCVNIDKENDVRTLNNLRPTYRWAETIMHEMGHAIYELNFDPTLPWLLREPSHTCATEGLANFMGAIMADPQYVPAILGIPAPKASTIIPQFQRFVSHERLVFMRWSLVMTLFEQQLYANPDGDLDSIWYDLVEKYQHIKPPKKRNAPDWAAKIHIALVPVYYHNYALGYLFAAQLEAKIRAQFGGLINQPEAGAWILNNFTSCGAQFDWRTHIQKATGEPLNVDYFIQSASL
ncbi:MAG: M2 family metallopeptidase [Chitinivibrionales bacterium]|nr:M2 family metallopeptidase [Chitinivibrionales bacterium]